MGMTTEPVQFVTFPWSRRQHRSVDVDENDFVEGFRNKTCQCSKLNPYSAKLNLYQMLDYSLQAKRRENANASVYVQKEQVNFTHCNDHMFIQIPN